MNRVVEWREDGIYYEADQRHAEIIIATLGLESNSKSVSTPGRKGSEQVDTKLEEAQASTYRALVARAN